MQALQILVDMKGTKENEEHYFLRTSRYQGDCEVFFLVWSHKLVYLQNQNFGEDLYEGPDQVVGASPTYK